jgi:hypothetical protein
MKTNSFTLLQKKGSGLCGSVAGATGYAMDMPLPKLPGAAILAASPDKLRILGLPEFVGELYGHIASREWRSRDAVLHEPHEFQRQWTWSYIC